MCREVVIARILCREQCGGSRMPKQVFISYSRSDDDWRKRLVLALKPYARAEQIDYFDDTQLEPGGNWRAELDQRMTDANVAVLLVSANYLGSGFVSDVELPHIVERAHAGALTIAWIPVSASAYEITALKDIQALLSPKRPLDQLRKPQADEALVKAARLISGGGTVNSIGRAMHVADEVYRAVATEGRASDEAFKVQARHTGTAVAFVRKGRKRPIAIITAEDLENLPPGQHQLIDALAESMYSEYDRWIKRRRKLATLTPKELAIYKAAGTNMCSELNNILTFIEMELNKDLEDHYSEIRFACKKLVASP